MDAKFRSRAIRREILKVLHNAAVAGQTESGSWLNILMLRSILDTWGYRLTDIELRRHCVYLHDSEIACIDMNDALSVPGQPKIYRLRIRAKGMRVLEGEERVPGVADE